MVFGSSGMTRWRAFGTETNTGREGRELQFRLMDGRRAVHGHVLEARSQESGINRAMALIDADLSGNCSIDSV